MKSIALLALSAIPLFGGTYSLEIAPTTEAAFIELPIPAGTIVKKASDGGSYDASRGVIKWGPLLPAPASVTFTLENEPGDAFLVPAAYPGTLNVTANVVTQLDSDLDGLPDDFEALYQVDDPSIDHDGDGLSTYAEFLLGTNPREASSGLTTISVELRENTLTWQVSPELPDFVTLEAAVSPDAQDWISIPFTTQDDGAATTLTAPLNSSNQRRFFRLRFEP
jgi:hypothetical protein